MNQSSRSCGEAGFTVLELVVCLGLLALISALTAEGLSIAKRGKEVMSLADRQDQTHAVRIHLRRTFEGAVPLFATEPDQTTRLVFGGEPDRLWLVNSSDGRLEASGLVLVELTMGDGGESGTLITNRRVISPAADPSSGIIVHRLLDRVTNLSFRYYGRNSSNTEPEWHDEWLGTKALPALVAVELSGRSLSWPPLIVALPAANESSNP